jgi:hypothetical protein
VKVISKPVFFLETGFLNHRRGLRLLEQDALLGWDLLKACLIDLVVQPALQALLPPSGHRATQPGAGGHQAPGEDLQCLFAGPRYREAPSREQALASR